MGDGTRASGAHGPSIMTTSKRAVSKAAFLKAVSAAGSRFREDNAAGRLNTLLAEESAPVSVLQGYLIESYHYIKSAPQHIGVALTHAKTAEHKTILLDLLLDEHDHAPMILHTLKRLGFQEKAIVASTPTIGTLSLISLLSDLGRTHPLAYIACTSLNEATEEDVKNEKRSFRFFADKYRLPKNAFDGFLAHSEEDLRSGHVRLIEKALSGVKSLSREEADGVIDGMYAIGRAYKQFNDSVAAYYATPGCRVPRPQSAQGSFD